METLLKFGSSSDLLENIGGGGSVGGVEGVAAAVVNSEKPRQEANLEATEKRYKLGLMRGEKGGVGQQSVVTSGQSEGLLVNNHINSPLAPAAGGGGNGACNSEESAAEWEETGNGDLKALNDDYCSVSQLGYRCVSYQKPLPVGLQRDNSIDASQAKNGMSPNQNSHSLRNGNDDVRGGQPRTRVSRERDRSSLTSHSSSSSREPSVCSESPPPLNNIQMHTTSLSPKHKRALYHRKHYPPGHVRITPLSPASTPTCTQDNSPQHNNYSPGGGRPNCPNRLSSKEQSLHTNNRNNSCVFDVDVDHNKAAQRGGKQQSPTASPTRRVAGSDSTTDFSPLLHPSPPLPNSNTSPPVIDRLCQPSNRGHTYSRIPVLRVELADDPEEDDEEGVVVVDNRLGGGKKDSIRPMAPTKCVRATPSSSCPSSSIRRPQEGRQMEEDEEPTTPPGGVGLQAIDLQELQRRRRTRQKKKNKFIKNILILSFGFVSLFSATSGLIILQSSLNRRMGVLGLCANFVAVAISCLLLPKALIQLLGCKWTIVASMSCFILWIMSNLHPTWGTLIPSAVVMGTGWAPLWTAQCTYFTVTGIEYAKWADNMPDVVIARMFGIFFMIFMTASIWGNLLSSSVLSNGHFNNRTRPLPLPGDPESIYRFCGAADCPDIYANITNENYNRPENSLVYTLVGLYLGLSLIGITLVAFFLDRLELERDADKPKCTAISFTASLKQITNPYQIFIIPLTIYTGMEQVFLTVEYTRAYATCALGMEKIGYVVISYATVAALFSLASSQLVNVVGRMPLFLIGAGAHIGCMVVFMRWTPYPDSLIMFIIMPAIWGIGDAIWQSQINAFYGILFSDQSEAAFANYRMWESVGFIVSLSYSPFLCVYIKIYILIGCLITGLVGYFVVEGLYSKASSELETELAKKGLNAEAETSESDGPPFSGLAQMIRRKSSVYLPQSAVREAAEVMRRKSNAFLTPGQDNPEKVIRRRLSTFAPVLEENEENSPMSSVCSTPVAHQRVSSLVASDDVFEGDKLEDENDFSIPKSEHAVRETVNYSYKREYEV